MPSAIDSREFRHILGHYPTGVCAVTAVADGVPVGMIVGSFTSVSLEPPLVAFLPDRSSTTWPRVMAAGAFCVNVLTERQQSVCDAISSKAPDKFETIAYRLSGAGVPIIEGVVAWVECDVYAVHEAGDHFIAIGLVKAMAVEQPESPLVFHRGSYRSISALAAADWQMPAV